jgi:tetratricopeptide (TPR) repeat protein
MGIPSGHLIDFGYTYIWGIAHKSQGATLINTMDQMRLFLKCIVTFLCLFWAQGVFAVDASKLDGLFEQLAAAEASDADLIEQTLYAEMSRSGSDAMDLLLERGRSALEAGDSLLAIEHLTALIDHAPNFAEGYNARATGYYHAGLYGVAMADIGKTLTLEPRHFGALSGLALILEELGQSENALKILRSIQKIHPHMNGLAQRIERLELALTGAAL